MIGDDDAPRLESAIQQTGQAKGKCGFVAADSFAAGEDGID